MSSPAKSIIDVAELDPREAAARLAAARQDEGGWLDEFSRYLDRHRAGDWTWWRITYPGWSNLLDPSYAARYGGRWNLPDSYPTLYFNQDQVTARMNLRGFIAHWPYEPEDLRSDTGPVLVGATLPRAQKVCDIHSPEGVKAAGLPKTYPFDSSGKAIPRRRCQPIGARVRMGGLRGVRSRSAQSRGGAGRDLAWSRQPAEVSRRSRRC